MNRDQTIYSLTVCFCLGFILLMGLYSSSVNKELATKHRVLLAEEKACEKRTGGFCYIKILTAEELTVVQQHRIKKGNKYGIY